MTAEPRIDDDAEQDRVLGAMWREFVAGWRHRRAPLALRDRVAAALEAPEASQTPGHEVLPP